jgi:dipeptidyl aminopeptidase/acylaminoacyl peptidase
LAAFEQMRMRPHPRARISSSSTSSSRNDRYWKISSFTATNLLAYLYDRKAKSLTKLYDPRPDLAAAPLVEMRPLTIRSRDGLNLVSYLSLPKGSDTHHEGIPDNPLPLVLVVHRGPHNRDSIGFANRGYAALSVNMRGSTGFGKAFVNASIGEWGRKLDDDLLDAVGWAIQNKIADPARVAIMGASYGGYAALTGLSRDPDTYACGIDLFGPSDLLAFELTQASYLTTGVMLRKEFGDPSTEEGRAVMKAQSPLFNAAQIRKPLIVTQGANDPSVKQELSDRMVWAVRANGVPVTYVLYPDEGHGFQRAATRWPI